MPEVRVIRLGDAVEAVAVVAVPFEVRAPGTDSVVEGAAARSRAARRAAEHAAMAAAAALRPEVVDRPGTARHTPLREAGSLVEVVSAPSGRPRLRFERDLWVRLGRPLTMVSLTHDAGLAGAVVVLRPAQQRR